jgi:hypothetical protein
MMRSKGDENYVRLYHQSKSGSEKEESEIEFLEAAYEAL